MILYAGLPERPKSIMSTRTSSAKFVHIAPIIVSTRSYRRMMADMSGISPKPSILPPAKPRTPTEADPVQGHVIDQMMARNI
jgi:hypothetical protein